ncbi:MAG: hypothetical protein AB7Q01_08485 [Gammaproteobacteria bacterium]
MDGNIELESGGVAESGYVIEMAKTQLAAAEAVRDARKAQYEAALEELAAAQDFRKISAYAARAGAFREAFYLAQGDVRDVEWQIRAAEVFMEPDDDADVFGIKESADE